LRQERAISYLPRSVAKENSDRRHVPMNPVNDNNREPVAPKTRDKEFDEAVERVYQKYGPDLDAFVRDFQRDSLKIQFNTTYIRRIDD
jgi:hypothetical protein